MQLYFLLSLFRIMLPEKNPIVLFLSIHSHYFVAGANTIVLFFRLFRNILWLGKCNCVATMCSSHYFVAAKINTIIFCRCLFRCIVSQHKKTFVFSQSYISQFDIFKNKIQLCFVPF